MRVLITGGAGRLGITVCKAFLTECFQVRIFDIDNKRNRQSVQELGSRAEVIWGDITDIISVRQAMDGVDAVVHMAAILPPLANERPDLAARVNIGGTRILTDVIKERGGHLPFVFTSSVAVFGPTPDVAEPICASRNEPHPKGSYGQTKLQAEDVIKSSGIAYTILRLSATMYLVFSISDIKRMFTVPLDNRIEFSHPDDTSTAILNSVKFFHLVQGKTLVISGGPTQRMLYGDMVSRILRVLGLPLPPMQKFTTEPYYLDWYDTSESQKLLSFQRRTFTDYLADYSRQLAKRYSCLFLPFMLYFAGPLLGRIIVHFM